jgi:hypothetical protein
MVLRKQFCFDVNLKKVFIQDKITITECIIQNIRQIGFNLYLDNKTKHAYIEQYLLKQFININIKKPYMVLVNVLYNNLENK